MKAAAPSLIAVDGASDARILALAHGLHQQHGRRRSGISRWDASGLFEQLMVAGDEAGAPSARTLLLLYAADLGFRLRWEIQPAMGDGKTVIAAPYVETAMAFGRAAGLSREWLANLFQFAPRPAHRLIADGSSVLGPGAPNGFVEFGCRSLGGRPLGLSARDLATRTRLHLGAIAARPHRAR
jgi:hypothetical protein